MTVNQEALAQLTPLEQRVRVRAHELAAQALRTWGGDPRRAVVAAIPQIDREQLHEVIAAAAECLVFECIAGGLVLENPLAGQPLELD